MFVGDYHTHTKYSDGKNSVMQNAVAAAAKGLKEIAITDHGFNIPTMGLRKYLKAKADCKDATIATGIKVISGVEANIISLDGTLDVKDSDIEKIDYLIAGFHKFAIPKNIKSFFAMYFVTYFCGLIHTSKKAVKQNTNAVIKCIERYPIKVLTHIGHSLKVDAKAVAVACAEKGVLVELNAKHISDLRPIVADLRESGAKFILASDAHSASEVGELDEILQFALDSGIEKERIVNYVDLGE